ncbi:MAG: hypothetical protein ACE5IQ_00885 [Candidatus Methylomirabilales bacterium]
MSTHSAESLAKEVVEGTYTPSTIEGCTTDLPIDRNPQVVRFTQFTLFSNPELDPRLSNEPEYLILPPYRLRSPVPDPRGTIVENIVIPLADHLAKDMPTESLPVPDAPVDTIRNTLRDIGRHLPQPDTTPDVPDGGDSVLGAIDAVARPRPKLATLGLPNLELPEGELRTEYAGWLAEQQSQAVLSAVEPLRGAGLISEYDISPRITDMVDHWRDIFDKLFLPGPYKPFKAPHPHFALLVTFEQVWRPVGYTRGELINTISLAAGEALTVEIHSWDKSTIKSEEELAEESKLRVTENLTQRDVLTVVRQIGEHTGSHFDLNFKVPIPKAQTTVDLGGAGTSEKLNKTLTETLEQTRERTVEAAHTLKTSRKLRIEVSREVGREQKQTRVVSNTNRCHTLSYHYFEVMSNYLVTTRLVSVTPCLLLPNPAVRVTPNWVLCHEGILKEALLDKVYLPGFQAARILETHEVFLDMKKEKAKAKGDVPEPLQEGLREHVEAILGTYATLNGALRKVKKAADSNACKTAAFFGGALGWATCVAAKVGVTPLRRVLYLGMLQGNITAVNAVKKLGDDSKNDRVKSSDALRSFFAAVTPRDYQYNVVYAHLAKGLEAIGVPSGLVDALLGNQIVDLISDDAGLYNAVKAAAEKLTDIWERPPPQEMEDVEVKEGFSTMDIAQARVAFEQLQCHIHDNLLHYLQAMWLREHRDQRFLRLQSYGNVAAILQNEILGLLGHKAAYRLTDLEAVEPWVKFEEMRNGISAEPGEPQLVTLPTPGTVDEAVLGECDVCEPFIQQSRLIDLRVQDAKAKQEESEAARYGKRVETGDYSDPRGRADGKVIINIDGDETEPSE